jgi:outer membrane protein TolC
LTGSYRYNSEFPNPYVHSSFINKGFNAGVNLSWNIFDGGTTKIRVQNAQINLENQQIRKEQLKHQLRSFISNTYYNYQNKRYVLQSQKENLKTAQRNFERTGEQFKLGSVSSVEYRQAQLNLLNAQTAILHAKYDAKIVELQLLQVTGRLLDHILITEK